MWGDSRGLVQTKPQKAQVLEKRAASRQRIGCSIGDPFVMHTPGDRCAQKQDRQDGIDQQEVFDRMGFLFPLELLVCSVASLGR